MPRFVDYPRSSLKRALEIANAVQELGGSCTIETCADHLRKKISGSFNAQVSSATKYNFITSQKGTLTITSHYKKLSLAYSEDEKNQLLQESFFEIPVFKSIYERFVNGKLPVNTLDRILIREFEVPDKIANRVANYFIHAAKEANLLNADNSFVKVDEYGDEGNDEISNEEDNNDSKLKNTLPVHKPKDRNNYMITISGPGIQFQKEVNSVDDFIIVNAIIDNIKKHINQKNEIE